MTKNELRAAMRLRNRAMSVAARAAASEAIMRAVSRLPAFAGARCVGLFCALADEPDLRCALNAWSRTRRVVVPRVEGDEMRFFEYDPATLRTGAFGIAEPGAGARLCEPQQIDLLVVPGVAFTAAGDRLGRGRGYYDKYLSQPGFRAVTVGVGYRHQLVVELPVVPHDICMNQICVG